MSADSREATQDIARTSLNELCEFQRSPGFTDQQETGGERYSLHRKCCRVAIGTRDEWSGMDDRSLLRCR